MYVSEQKQEKIGIQTPVFLYKSGVKGGLLHGHVCLIIIVLLNM